MRQLEAALWISSALVVAWTARLIHSGRTDLTTTAWTVAEAPRTPPLRQDLGDVAARVVAGNPFRLDRKAAPLPFGTSLAAMRTPSELNALRITGIAGPPWRASLTGIPGRTGELLIAAGDSVGQWLVLSVRQDSVVIQTQDTVWRIKLRNP